ncbi:TPA: glucosyltransferase domain-containing protein [Escherichia coli]
MTNNKNYHIPFILIGLFYLPFIINNQLYVDDIFRAQNGFDGWSQNGRPLADMLMHLLMISSSKLPGYGIFGQILSVIMMSMTAIFYARNTLGSTSATALICASGFAISPFFIENMLYQYDNLPMTLSLCGAVIASIYALKESKICFIASFMLIAFSSALYQTSINSYIALVAVNLTVKLYRSEVCASKSIVLSLRAIASLAIGMIVYSIIIKFIIPMTGGRGEGITLNASLIDYFIIRIIKFYTLLESTLSIYYVAIYLLVLVFLVAVAKPRISLTNLLMIVACLSVVAISPIGMLAVFGESAIAARMMMGAVGLTALIFSIISISKYSDTKKYFAVAVLAIPLYVTAYGFSFAIKEQRNYDTSILYMSINDIRNSPDYNLEAYIVFSGRAHIAPLSFNTVKAYPLISTMLVPAYDWTASMIAQSIGTPNVRFNFARKEQKKIIYSVCSPNTKPVKSTDAYSIFFNKESNGYLVWLKGGNNSPC